jgi:cytochrome c oxidase subunit 6b
MGNSQSLCQAEQQHDNEKEEEKVVAEAVEELFTGKSSDENENPGSFVPDSVTVKPNEDPKQEPEIEVVSVETEEIQDNDDAEEENQEEEEKKTIVLQTAPIDPRFPGANAARHCFVAYNEYHKCRSEKGADARECNIKARTYRSICPAEWIAHWNELREEGTWFGKY